VGTGAFARPAKRSETRQRHEIESPSRRGCLEPGSRHLCKKRGCPFFEFFARILCDGVGTMMPAASGFRCHGSKVSSPAIPNLALGIDLRQPRPYATFSLVAGSRTTPFPQLSTARNPYLVTNNLDREFRKEQARCVRQFSATGSCFKSEAKSLFLNILAVSPCGSRFYSGPPHSHARKLFEMRILAETMKKMSRGHERYGVQ
jgi:hypothetical protein